MSSGGGGGDGGGNGREVLSPCLSGVRPKVSALRANWAVHEDGALAQKLQSQEISQHLKDNKQRNRQIRYYLNGNFLILYFYIDTKKEILFVMLKFPMLFFFFCTFCILP